MSESADELSGLVQVGAIDIKLLMHAKGTAISYKLDGIEPEAAIGHLGTITRRLERAVDAKWGDDFSEGDDEVVIGEVEVFHFTCPCCDEEVDVPIEDMDGFTTHGNEDDDAPEGED